jgi:hypothetical protein
VVPSQVPSVTPSVHTARMIASNRCALRVGTAKLVVDGADEPLCREATFSLSPGRVNARALDRLVALSRETYNAAPQHRREAWTPPRSPKPGPGRPVSGSRG